MENLILNSKVVLVHLEPLKRTIEVLVELGRHLKVEVAHLL